MSASSAGDFTMRQPRTTGAPALISARGITLRSPSTAKKRTVSSMPTAAVTLRSRRMPATVANGSSCSFHTRTSAGTRRLSRTEGSSKCGVTMARSPSRGSTAAVSRSLRHHCTPVKYTSDAPGSMSNAPMPCLPMSARALSRRARYSAPAMGWTPPVMGASSEADPPANNRADGSEARAATPPKERAWRRVMRIEVPRSIRLVGLLFDDGRAHGGVDALLDGGAFVVHDVHGARELDELLAESLGALLVTDLVLDDPQLLVHAREIGFFVADVHRGGAGVTPGLFQQGELMFHVGHLHRIAHARGLDAQDGDLVEHLAGAEWNQDVFHLPFLILGAVAAAGGASEASSSSSFAVTASVWMSSMTPGISIFFVQGSSPAGLLRNFRAAASYRFTHQ